MNVEESAASKRRKAYSIAAACGVIAWFLILMATQLWPFLDVPTPLLPTVIGPVVIGYFFALALAIGYEAVSEAIRQRTSLFGKFVAWELELLSDGESRDRDEIFKYLITKSESSELEIKFLMPEVESRHWQATFDQSIASLEEHGLVLKIWNDYTLSLLGSLIAKEKLTAITPSKLKRLAKRHNLYLANSAEAIRERPLLEDKQWRSYMETAEPSIKGEIHLEKIEGEFADLTSETRRESPVEKPRQFPVWFGTNRRPHNPENLALGFSRRGGEKTYYGRCVVNIPKGHNTGETQPALLQRWLLGEKGVVVKSIEGLPEATFWAALSQALRVDREMNSMLLFIHGFNVSFVDAAIRTAQLKFDLGMNHAAFFSWPSLKLLWGYGGDSTSAREATAYLAPFLTQLAGIAKNETINLHVVAHSMGNEAFLYALERALLDVKGDVTRLQLAELVFAAPDVDAKIFRDKAARAIPTSRQRTLYASRRDRPLGFSKWLRIRRPRAGRIPPVTIVNQIDTVDVSRIDLSKLGHGYVAEARPVITDMSIAMHFNAPPAKRVGLDPTNDPAGRYWVIR